MSILMLEPKNETEVIIAFSQQCVNLPNIGILSFSGNFPDAIIIWNQIEYTVEFEYKSANFWVHGHNPKDCDLIICWINDDLNCALPVVELSQPDWYTKNPILIKDTTKELNYWKKRALEAEKRLKFQYRPPRAIEVSSENEKLIKQMFNGGFSNIAISQEVWGKGKFGSYYNRIINQVVNS